MRYVDRLEGDYDTRVVPSLNPTRIRTYIVWDKDNEVIAKCDTFDKAFKLKRLHPGSSIEGRFTISRVGDGTE